MSSNTAPWLQIRLVRSRTIIEHETPYTRKFTEEITILNTSVSDVNNIPFPLPDFRHGLQIIDSDNSMISFYSRNEIDVLMATLERPLHETLERQLTENYLVWIHLPIARAIKPNELRTIRFIWKDPETAKNPIRSIFDIAQFSDTYVKGDHPLETFVLTYPPKDFDINICKKETKATDLETKEEVTIDHYTEKDSSFKNDRITIKNSGNSISMRLPAKNNLYKISVNYQIKLSRLDRWGWRVFLPFTALALLAMVIIPSTSYASIISLNKESLIGIGGAVVTVAATLIILSNNPLLRRTRGLLFTHIILGIILIIRSGVLSQ